MLPQVFSNNSDQSLPILDLLEQKKHCYSKEVKKPMKMNDKIELQSCTLVHDEYVVYNFVISHGNAFWQIQKRYKELFNFYDKLPVEEKRKLPEFPKKQFLGNLNTSFIQKRFTKLVQFTNEMTKNKNIKKQFMKSKGQVINDPSDLNNFKLDF